MQRPAPPGLQATTGPQRLCCCAQAGLPLASFLWGLRERHGPRKPIASPGTEGPIAPSGASPTRNKFSPFTVPDPPYLPFLLTCMYVLGATACMLSMPQHPTLDAPCKPPLSGAKAGAAPPLPMPRGFCFPRHVLPCFQRPSRHPKCPMPPSQAATVPHFNRLQDPRGVQHRGFLKDEMGLQDLRKRNASFHPPQPPPGAFLRL